MRAYNAVKCDCDRWGSLQRSPDLLAGFKGAAKRRRERREGKEGEGEGRGGQVDSDAQLEQGRQLAKSALISDVRMNAQNLPFGNDETDFYSLYATSDDRQIISNHLR